MTHRRKVLLIGWDAADWKAINPLMDSGMLPNLQRLVEGGVIGNSKTLDPPLSPMLWTSIATGKRPYKHGILGFTETRPDKEGIQPVTVTHRKVRAIWNMLTHHGYKSHVVGWWPSHPAEPINGICISNFYQRAKGKIDEEWPIMDGTIHPKEKQDLFAKMRIHPGELTSNHISPFVPKMDEVDQEKTKSLPTIAKFLAESASIHAAATYIAEHEEWNFLAVYYDALDHFKHSFMKFHPPKLPHIPDEEFELYKEIVTGAYRFHDMMLGRWMDLIDEDTTIMLISDHGFHSDHLRPIQFPKEPSGPAYEHNPYGIFCLSGENIKEDEIIHGASILDITPTILSLFDLPIGRDMDGKVLMNVFKNPPILKVIDSWENLKGNFGTHPKNVKTEEIDEESLKQLVELGYIEDPGENLDQAKHNTIKENQFYLARAYLDGGKNHEAIQILEVLCEQNPDQVRYAMKLAKAYHDTVQFEKCLEVINRLRKHFKADIPPLGIMEGMVLVGQGKLNEALEKFEKASAQIGNQPMLSLRIAHCYRLLKRYDKARFYYEKEVQINPDNDKVHYGLGLCDLEQERPKLAVEHFLDAIGLNYQIPMAHYHLGEALYKLKDFENALNAFQVSLQMQPSLNKARQRIIRIYEEKLGTPQLAIPFKADIKKNMGQQIVVVSGLPRSGTSMMMQMIARAGIPLFIDEKRKADESNPKGYNEHEVVKKLTRDNSWLDEVSGKCIKVISQLLPYLPDTHQYKVVLMKRNIDEVLMSQKKMLERLGKDPSSYSINLKDKYQISMEKAVAWCRRRTHVKYIEVDYDETIRNPIKTAEVLNEFLETEIILEEISGVVDQSLYRERVNK